MFMLRLDYPSFEDEVEIVKSTTGGSTVEHKALLSGPRILELQNLVRRTPAADNVIQRAVRIVSMTRPGTPQAPGFVNQQVSWGAGPRASQYLVLGAKCRAILHGRPTPDIEDLHRVALPVLRHRVLTSFAAEAEGVRSDDVIQRLLEL